MVVGNQLSERPFGIAAQELSCTSLELSLSILFVQKGLANARAMYQSCSIDIKLCQAIRLTIV